jgi:hypothetical protein
MRELTLIRDPDDKRRLDLEPLGTFRWTSAAGHKATLSAPSHPDWHLGGRIMLRDVTHITDQLGTKLGTFTASKRAIELGPRTLHVRKPKEGWTGGPQPVELIEDERVLARYAPWAWDGKRPITVEIVDEEFAGREPLLVLLGLYGTVPYAISSSAAAAASAGTANP